MKNKTNKKNLKGFTLVELIVVMTILGILMGAILNLIRPTNQLFTTSKRADDTNTICSGVMSYLENNLRYATNVTVLEDYKGVPKVTGSVVGNSVNNLTKYSKVIIIDSNTTNIRGSSQSAFDATSSPARRKKAYGQILSIDLSETGGTIDLTKANIALTEDYYSDYGHDFDVSLTQDSSHRYYFTTNMKTYLPESQDDGTYKFDNMVFDHERSFELKNVNLNTGCSVKDYLNTVQSLNYYLYPQATAPAGLTSLQEAYYDTSKTYTYIFYTDVVPSSTSKCTVQIVDRNSSNVYSFKVKNSNFITDDQESNAIGKVESEYDEYNSSTGATEHYVFEKFEEISGSGGFMSDYKSSLPVTNDLIFKPVYTMVSSSSPSNKVYFYSNYNSTLNYFDPPVELYSFWIDNGTDSTGSPGPQYGKMQGEVTDAPCVEDMQFDGWYDSSGNPYVSGMTYSPTVDYYYYAKFSVRPKYTVSFEVDGASYGSPITDVYSGTQASVLTFPADPSKSGYNFLGWFTTDDYLASTVSITSNITFVAKFEAIPATPPEWTETTVTINYAANTFNHLIICNMTNGGDFYAGLTSASSQWYIDMYPAAGNSATVKVKFKTANPSEFELKIMDGWNSPYPSGSGIVIKCTNFVGKSSATITIDNAGNVSYS